MNHGLRGLHGLVFLCVCGILFGQDKPHDRYEWFLEGRRGPDGRVQGAMRLEAYKQLERLRLLEAAKVRTGQKISASDWTLIGPQPTNSGANASSGRVTALAVDPRNPDVAYAGAAEGGVWKTTDGGAHWIPLTDDQPSLATGALALDPSNSDIVYAGTGEANQCGDCYYGAGILKTTDAGASWTLLPGPFVQQGVSSLAVHPTNSQILLAAIARANAPVADASGIYRSTDGGVTWRRVQTGARGNDVFFEDHNNAFASVYGAGVFKSTDAGATWTPINGTGSNTLTLQNAGRIALAQAPSRPLTLYAAIADLSSSNSGGLLGLFKTTDGGQNWIRLTTPNYCGPQCWYNNVLSVAPNNPDIVYAGGVQLIRSLDGGSQWSPVGQIHVDQHALTWAPGASRLYIGNDGGVYSAADGNAPFLAISNLNSTLAITQFYPSLAIHPADVAQSVAGTQDNSTQRYFGSNSWSTVTCGDGGWSIIDQSAPSIVYVTCQRIDIRKSTNGGFSFTAGQTRGIGSDPVQFIPPLVADPTNYQRLYFGTDRVYQSNDGAGSWVPVSPNLAFTTTGGLTSIAVSVSDPNTVYIGSRSGAVHVTANVSSASRTWTRINDGLPARLVSQIVVDPASGATAYVSFQGFTGLLAGDTGGHIFRTNDRGGTWLDISGNLPNVPVNDLVLDPDLPGTLYAATDVGVFRTTDDGLSWAPLGNSLPRVVVMALRLHRPTRTLRAATHGRSVWDLQVPLPAGRNPAPGLASVNPASAAPGNAPVQLTINGFGFISGSTARWNGQAQPTAVNSATQLTATISPADLKSGIAQVDVVNPGPGGGASNALVLTVAATPAINAGGTVNAASFAPGPVAPGSLATMFGVNLGLSAAASSSLPLPLQLGIVTGRLGTFALPLVFVSPGQVNFQVPWELGNAGSAALTISVGGISSAPQTVSLASAAPGIFTSGGTQGVILIANSSFLAGPAGEFPSARPAQRGETISIFATGLGAVTNRPGSGAAAPADPLAMTLNLPVVTIGGADAEVTFSGLAPGFAGLYQVNVKVPATTPSGDRIALVMSLLGRDSNTVTLAVQ